MLRIQPAFQLPALGITASNVGVTQNPVNSQSSEADARFYVGVTLVTLLVGGLLALSFYRASKGISDTYVSTDDHWGHRGHHGGGGITFSFGGHH